MNINFPQLIFSGNFPIVLYLVFINEDIEMTLTFFIHTIVCLASRICLGCHSRKPVVKICAILVPLLTNSRQYLACCWVLTFRTSQTHKPEITCAQRSIIVLLLKPWPLFQLTSLRQIWWKLLFRIYVKTWEEI